MLLDNPKTIIWITVGLCLTVAGCSKTDSQKPGPDKSGSATATPGASSSQPAGTPGWIAQSRSWPDTMRWVFDSVGEHVQDGLLMRLKSEVLQDFTPGVFKDIPPLQCRLFMTLRPIPEWPVARGLGVDSVILHDPVQNKILPTLLMLPAERNYESQTVRTAYLTQLKNPYTPNMTEGQLVEPTVFLHWDKRQIVATLPTVRLTFLRGDSK